MQFAGFNYESLTGQGGRDPKDTAQGACFPIAAPCTPKTHGSENEGTSRAGVSRPWLVGPYTAHGKALSGHGL